MKAVLLIAFAVAMPVAAAAQQVEPAPAPAPVTASEPVPAPTAGPLPICQQGVTDNCQQGPAAEARAAHVYEGGGRDHSATMTEGQAAAGEVPAQPEPSLAPAPPPPPAPAPASASTATLAATPAGGALPICQKGITDRCQQGASAEARAAHVYKGGGRDNSATMTERQATGGKVRAEAEPKPN